MKVKKLKRMLENIDDGQDIDFACKFREMDHCGVAQSIIRMNEFMITYSVYSEENIDLVIHKMYEGDIKVVGVFAGEPAMAILGLISIAEHCVGYHNHES